MKSSSHYIDLDDQLPAPPAPGAATRKEQPFPAPQAKPCSSPRDLRVYAIAAAWIPCGVLVPILFSVAESTRDLAASVAAWALLAANAGMAVAALLSWLATRAAGRGNYARVESPARECTTTYTWTSIPLSPYLGTRYLVRAMKQYPSVRYRYVLAFKECKLGTFVARSGMREANRLAVASGMNPQERAQWYSACEDASYPRCIVSRMHRYIEMHRDVGCIDIGHRMHRGCIVWRNQYSIRIRSSGTSS